MDSSTSPSPFSPNQLDIELYANILEQVFRAYERSLDLEIALAIIPMPDSTKARLTSDLDLLARINLCDAKIREDLMTDFRYLSKNAQSDGVRLQALKELGRTLYPKRFKENAELTIHIPQAIKYESVEPLA